MAASLDTEFLQGIRKRERHVPVGEAIVVVTAIKRVIDCVAGAARDKYGLRTEEALAARFV